MISTRENIRTDRDALLAALQEAGANVQKPKAIKCPFHDDRHASASVYTDDDGVWRYKCHAGGCGFSGDLFDVQARARGVPVEEALKDWDRQSRPRARLSAPPETVYASLDDIQAPVGGKIEARYEYTHPDTRQVELIVFRWVKDGVKHFWQASPVKGGFALRGPKGPKPLYNRTRIRKANKVVVVEGENCVHALAEIGVVATTSPGGAGKAEYADWSPLAGKTVYLWPDNDPLDDKGVRVGIRHMEAVRGILEYLTPAPTILWIDPDSLGLSPKGDVVDYLDTLDDLSQEGKRLSIGAVLQDAGSTGPSVEVGQVIEDAISGKRRVIGFPWPALTRLSRALRPGTVTLLCGDPGSTKSFLLLEAMLHWHRQGIPVALYELEEGRAYHLHRALAQLDGNADLFDDEWIKAHPDEAREAHHRHSAVLDDFGARIEATANEQVTLTKLAEWVEARLADGCQIIGIDPVTAAEATIRPWEEDLRFLLRVKGAVSNAGARLILITHPKKGRKTAVGLDELSGGAAYARFSQTVLWLEDHQPPKEMLVKMSPGEVNCEVSRTVRISKARNGRGAGLHLAFSFDGQTLRFKELGVVSKESKR